MRKLTLVILIVLLLVVSSFFPLVHVNPQTATAQGSCPSNDVLTAALNPLPNSFNQLTTAGIGAGHEIGYIEDLSTTPFYAGPNDSLVWIDSLTDWYTHNTNFTQWTFNIRPGEKWSNGSAITSSDLLAYWSPSVALNPLYDFTVLHKEIVRQSMLNSSEFVFYLNQSDAHVPEEMSSYYYTNVMSPSDIARGASFNEFGPFAAPGDVVSGPFGVVNYTSGASTVEMYRNPYYNPLPGPCGLTIDLTDSTAAFIPLIASGQVDFAGPLDPADASTVLKTNNMHIWTGEGLGINPLVYNVSSYPFNEPAFRQAIAYSINYSQMVQTQSGYAVNAGTAEGTVSPVSGLYNPNIPQYSYNPTKALSLLNSIGITKGSDGVLHYSNGTAVSFTIFTVSSQAYLATEAKDVQLSLKSIGMQVSTQVVGVSIGPSVHTNANNIDHNMFILSGQGDVFQDPWIAGQPPCDVYTLFCLSKNTVTPASAQSAYSGNLTILDGTDNPTQDNTALNNIQQIDAQNLPVIILSYPDILFAYSTARWTNWQASSSATNLLVLENHINKTTLATLVPVGATTSTPSTSSHASSVSTTTSSASSSSTQSSTALSLTSLMAIGVAVVVITGVGMGYTLRRRRHNGYSFK